MTETITVSEALGQLGVTRLTHFTPSKNLPHILRDGMIRSSKDLADNAPEYFSPTDRERFDRQSDKVCCSFQYPNGYYLAKARTKNAFLNYPDWVCLLLDIQLAERPAALFSVCNAAKGSGVYLKPGGQAVLACFAATVGEWSRRERHHPQAPTTCRRKFSFRAQSNCRTCMALLYQAPKPRQMSTGGLARWG